MAKLKKKNIFEKFLGKKVTRRDFIKYSAIGIAAAGAGGYFLKKLLEKPEPLLGLWKWSKEAYFYEKEGGNVRCTTCPNGCVLGEGQRSQCRSKVNFGGKLYSLSYGNPCAVNVDPIEKKPLFHFFPSSQIFSIATAGCTFRCLNCQNWDISQKQPEETNNYDMFPEEVVAKAQSYDCNSIAYTYSEPTSFYEYMFDTSKLASEAGLKNVWVTNGSINEKPLRKLCKYLDAANVDLKTFDNEVYQELCQGRKEPVMDSLKILDEEGKWFEVTNLVVPSWSDDLDTIREMCKWQKSAGLEDYPLHFSRFHPQYKLLHLPMTPVSTLNKAREIALEEGIKYVYIGNVAGTEAQNTFCPKCGKIVIKRNGYIIEEINIQDHACKFCGETIAGVF